MFKQIAFYHTSSLPLLLALLFMGGLVYVCRFHPAGERDRYPSGERRGPARLAEYYPAIPFPAGGYGFACRASLATSGLLLQTLFRNPLAGPSILGISDGANLGVAAIMLYFGGTLSMVTELPISGYLAVIIAAFAGAACILGLIIWVFGRGEEQCHAADHRYHDRLPGLFP